MASSSGSSEEVSTICSLTGVTPEEAQFFLEANNGDVQQAASMALESTPSRRPAAARQSANTHIAVPPRPLPPAQPAENPVGRPRGPRSPVEWILHAPMLVIGGGIQFIVYIVSGGLSAVGFVGSRILPQPILRLFQRTVHAIEQGNAEIDAQEAAVSFNRQFTTRYGDIHPRFLECSWQEAAVQAQNQRRSLFVYLHSRAHEDTEQFCTGTLCSSPLVDYVTEHFVCWGGDIRSSDAYRLSAQLRVSRYPCVAVLVSTRGRAKLIQRLEGHQSPTDLLSELQRGQNVHSAQLAAEQASIQEQDTNRRLREEQDAAFQQSLREDQERERKRKEQRKAEEDAKQAAADAERRAKEEEDARQRAVVDAAEALQRRKQEKAAALGPAPQRGSPDTTAVRIRLKDGSSHQRAFSAQDSLQAVFDFVESLDQLDSWRYSLVSTYPRLTLSQQSSQQSLSQLQLVPQATLFVQPED